MAEPSEIQSRKPSPVRKGDRLTAATVNTIIDAVRRTQGGVKSPEQVKPLRPAGTGSGILNAKTATTENITLAGLQTIDGVVMAAGDKVLVKDQTDTEENGLYKVSASTWSRSGTLESGSAVVVRMGQYQAGTLWILTNDEGFTVS
jgi:hypothetical protein